MIDHVSINVTDYARSREFYKQLLAALDYELLIEVPASVTPNGVDAAGFGESGRADFWIAAAATAPHQHFAFRARSRAVVDQFHRAGLAAGGKDNGPPGPRPHYHPNYYGAFILDPDGHNVEAVCRDPA